MTRSGDELAPKSSQSRAKGRNHVRILALEEVNDGYRIIIVMRNGYRKYRLIAPAVFLVAILSVCVTGTVGARAESSSSGRLTWYFAEGSTWPGFDEWLLVLNPNDEPSEIVIELMTTEGCVKRIEAVVEKCSRMNFHVNDYLPNKDVSAAIRVANYIPVVAERSMYFNAPGKWGSHSSAGVGGPGTRRGAAFAEGCTTPGFDEWILVLPVEADTTVDMKFITSSGEVIPGPSIFLKVWQRCSVHVNDYVCDQEVSATVSSDWDIVAERSMYITVPGKYGCHNATGDSIFDSTAYEFAEGCTREGFEDWLIIFNPCSLEVSGVVITFITPEGVADEWELSVPPKRRLTIRVNDIVPNDDVSILVTGWISPKHAWVVAERTLYVNTPDGKRGSLCTKGTRGHFFAEGCTTPGFDEWLLVMNCEEQRDVRVHISFIGDDGGRVECEPVDLPPRTRRSIHVNDYVTGNISAQVTATTSGPYYVSVACARSMYMDGRSGKWGASSSVGL